MNVDKLVKMGQGVLIAGAIASGGIALATKVYGTVKAGPEAKAEIEQVRKEVRQLKHGQRFIIRVLEKKFGDRYRPDPNDREELE
jgi:hypothetical protein